MEYYLSPLFEESTDLAESSRAETTAPVYKSQYLRPTIHRHAPSWFDLFTKTVSHFY